MDRGAWQAVVHSVSKGLTRLSDWHFHFHLNSAEMMLSSFWFPFWGSHTASLSIHSYFIFIVMEKYNSTCFSFFTAQPENPLFHTEHWVVLFWSSERAQRWGKACICSRYDTVFCMCSGTGEPLLGKLQMESHLWKPEKKGMLWGVLRWCLVTVVAVTTERVSVAASFLCPGVLDENWHQHGSGYLWSPFPGGLACHWDN